MGTIGNDFMSDCILFALEGLHFGAHVLVSSFSHCQINSTHKAQASAAQDGRRFTINVSTKDSVANSSPIIYTNDCSKSHTKMTSIYR